MLRQRPFGPPNERRILTFSLEENPGDPHSERSAKNCLAGKRWPSGWYLNMLVRELYAVALAVLKLAERDGMGAGLALRTLRDAHVAAVQSIDEVLAAAMTS